MEVFNQFPYTNFHELNQDWILDKIKEFEAIVSNVRNRPLNFTGAVTASYDGSEQVNVNIPVAPTALPNPNALTFTGAVNGTYDGSAPLSVVIPQGGGGGGGYTYGGSIVVNTTSEQGAGTVHINRNNLTLHHGDLLIINYAPYNNSGYTNTNLLYYTTLLWTALGEADVSLTAVHLGEHGATHALARTVKIKPGEQGGFDITYGTGYKASIGQSGAAAVNNTAIGIGSIVILKRN